MIIITVLISVAAGIAIHNLAVSYAMKMDSERTQHNAVTGIIDGAEPVFLQGSNGTACLLVHGFIGSSTDFGRLPQILNQAGYTVSVPLLPGHGTDPRDFSKIKSEDLLRSVHEAHAALRAKHQKVVLIGFSMGGSLSILEAQESGVDALILLAPLLKVKHFWYYVLPNSWYQRMFKPFIPYLYRPACFQQLADKAGIPGIVDYRFISLSGVDATLEIRRRAAAVSSRVKGPILILHSKKDKAIDYQASHRIAEQLRTEDVRLVSLEKSNHILLRDYESSQVEKEILDFLKGLPSNTTEDVSWEK